MSFGRQKYCHLGGGGDNLIGLGYGDVLLFRGTFFLKSAELWVSVFEIFAELWLPFEDKCRIMGCILEQCCKLFVVY